MRRAENKNLFIRRAHSRCLLIFRSSFFSPIAKCVLFALISLRNLPLFICFSASCHLCLSEVTEGDPGAAARSSACTMSGFFMYFQAEPPLLAPLHRRAALMCAVRAQKCIYIFKMLKGFFFFLNSRVQVCSCSRRHSGFRSEQRESGAGWEWRSLHLLSF